MARIINFPRNDTKLRSILSAEMQAAIDSLPDGLAKCIGNSFEEISSLPIAKQKSFAVAVPSTLQEEELSKIKDDIEKIIESYQDEILPVLRRLVEKEAELCMLKHKRSQ